MYVLPLPLIRSLDKDRLWRPDADADSIADVKAT
jgi:hypothetical protein